MPLIGLHTSNYFIFHSKSILIVESAKTKEEEGLGWQLCLFEHLE
jgi:hypothetical protein